ncbi:hypothetical protein [Chryseolinea lacunae]|uniref:Uncharacterized protein n=1 Tax=Chryseolinea lacunae TaxID=2801331 RepID=A0ABS1L0V1_9BACT|nr:hypothetical protein [Chryseolinea lacunae]MBL0745148.1 hypothetical protein [Chryseolinea lacunae]
MSASFTTTLRIQPSRLPVAQIAKGGEAAQNFGERPDEHILGVGLAFHVAAGEPVKPIGIQAIEMLLCFRVCLLALLHQLGFVQGLACD